MFEAVVPSPNTLPAVEPIALLNVGLEPNDAVPPNAGEPPKEGGLPNTGALPKPPTEGKIYRVLNTVSTGKRFKMLSCDVSRLLKCIFLLRKTHCIRFTEK